MFEYKACEASQGLGKPDYSGKLLFGVYLISLFPKLETILGLYRHISCFQKKETKPRAWPDVKLNLYCATRTSNNTVDPTWAALLDGVSD